MNGERADPDDYGRLKKEYGSTYRALLVAQQQSEHNGATVAEVAAVAKRASTVVGRHLHALAREGHVLRWRDKGKVLWCTSDDGALWEE